VGALGVAGVTGATGAAGVAGAAAAGVADLEENVRATLSVVCREKRLLNVFFIILAQK